MNPLVSIIIPVYNAEKYIEQCIHSLINQTLKNCEFIFINDGSIDNSENIINNYIKKDSRIKLINQSNMGVSEARNRGLDIANGEYIGFVDADDYVDINMYEKLYYSAIKDDCDVILSDWKNEANGKFISMDYNFPKNIVLNRNFIKENIIPYFLESDNLNTACNKLYKNKIIKENTIEFPKGTALGEDGIFNMKVFGKINTMKYIDYTGYYYREVEGSATRNILDKDYFKRALEVYQTDFRNTCDIDIDYNTEYRLKAIKLINSVISYIYIYFTSVDLNLKSRYRYIKNMINNNDVQAAVSIYISEKYKEIGRYEKFIIKMIKKKSTIGLYAATTYSKLRNQ